jgi:hypothetical protein
MKLYRIIAFLIITISLLMSSCAHIEENYLYENINPVWSPKKLEPILVQPIRFPVKKAIFSERNQSLYILDENNTELTIYRNQKLVNRIGRNSSGTGTIQRISDIALAKDGNLWLLDNFQKKLYKIDFNGMILSHFTLTEPLNPTQFIIDEYNSLIIYDKGRNDLMVYESLSLKYIYSFARMMFVEPLSLSAVKDRIWIYDKGQNKTFAFLTTGKLIFEMSGQWFYDTHLNLFQYEHSALQNKSNHFISPLNYLNRDTISTEGHFITHTGENQINVYEIKY